MTVRDIETGDRGEYVCVARAERYINIAKVTLAVRGKSWWFLHTLHLHIIGFVYKRNG